MVKNKMDWDSHGNLIYKGVLIQDRNGQFLYRITKYEYNSGDKLINVYKEQQGLWDNRATLDWS